MARPMTRLRVYYNRLMVARQEARMTLDEIRAALAHVSAREVADATGLSHATVANIRNGANVNPTLRTIKALRDWLAAAEKA